eukprot:UN0015
MGRAPARGFLDFMQAFDLEAGDLECQFLPCCALEYPSDGPSAIIGSMQVLECMRTAERHSLRALNMRHTFGISPVAVVHGNPKDGGQWELPERGETVVRPGDHLVFLCADGVPPAYLYPCMKRLRTRDELEKCEQPWPDTGDDSL